MTEPTTPPQDANAALRARILEALNTAPAAFIRDDPDALASHRTLPIHCQHHEHHHYNGGCALCRGEAETLADAVLAAIAEQVRETELRADRAENARDQLGRHLEIAQRELASVRLLAEQIKRYADWPGITDTATYPAVVESLRVCASGLVRALTAGPRPGGHQRAADGLSATPATNEPRHGEREAQKAPEPTVHAEEIPAVGPHRGQGTGRALCDTGDGTFDGAPLAQSSWQVNCEKCLAWPDEPSA